MSDNKFDFGQTISQEEFYKKYKAEWFDYSYGDNGRIMSRARSWRSDDTPTDFNRLDSKVTRDHSIPMGRGSHDFGSSDVTGRRLATPYEITNTMVKEYNNSFGRSVVTASLHKEIQDHYGITLVSGDAMHVDFQKQTIEITITNRQVAIPPSAYWHHRIPITKYRNRHFYISNAMQIKNEHDAMVRRRDAQFKSDKLFLEAELVKTFSNTCGVSYIHRPRDQEKALVSVRHKNICITSVDKIIAQIKADKADDAEYERQQKESEQALTEANRTLNIPHGYTMYHCSTSGWTLSYDLGYVSGMPSTNYYEYFKTSEEALRNSVANEKVNIAYMLDKVRSYPKMKLIRNLDIDYSTDGIFTAKVNDETILSKRMPYLDVFNITYTGIEAVKNYMSKEEKENFGDRIKSSDNQNKVILKELRNIGLPFQEGMKVLSNKTNIHPDTLWDMFKN